MCNEQIGQSALLLKMRHQVQNLCTDGDVQCGDRLIRHDELRIHDKGSCDTDSLSLAAGKLVREAACKLRKKSDVGKCAVNLLLPLLLGQMMARRIQALCNDVSDLRALIQRAHRILENHLNVLGDLMILLPRQLAGNSLSVKTNFALRHRIDPDDGTADRCFT